MSDFENNIYLRHEVRSCWHHGRHMSFHVDILLIAYWHQVNSMAGIMSIGTAFLYLCPDIINFHAAEHQRPGSSWPSPGSFNSTHPTTAANTPCMLHHRHIPTFLFPWTIDNHSPTWSPSTGIPVLATISKVICATGWTSIETTSHRQKIVQLTVLCRWTLSFES